MKRVPLLQSTIWLTLLLAALAVLYVPALGQGAVTIEQVQPARVANAIPTTLTVMGSGFANGATVALANIGPLATTFVNEMTLTAVLPALTVPGVHTPIVTNPDGGSAALPNGLIIIGPTSVQPNNVPNDAAVELVVTGIEFEEGSVVVLANYGALETTFVSGNLLRAALPAGVTPGTYTITVINPNAASSSLVNALTVTAAAGPTVTPSPTNTPAPTAFVRPLLVVQSYGASSAVITPGENLDFEMTLANAGQTAATNIVATFTTGDFVPRATGGVRAVENLAPGQSSRFFQPLTATRDLAGKSTGILEVQVSYTDVNGTDYNETFALTFPIVRTGGIAATATPTPTPTATPTAAPRLRPQLLVGDYQIDVNQLEPGRNFTLRLDVRNVGNATARRVSLIVGGGSSADGGLPGTPVAGGGLSGAGGEFTNFAPVGSSNVSFLGDLAVGESLTAEQRLIVNASTEAGAYPLPVSFVYTDEEGGSFVDDQVITLLVYQRPSVDINFYTEPPPLFTGEPGMLPLQVVNTGRNSAVFGNMSVTSEGAQFMNNSVFVGALDPGGFFPLDAQVIPEQPGSLDLLVRLNYTDDFNQQQTLTQTLTVEVMEAPIFEPGEGDLGIFEPPPVEAPPETLAQKIWRFILGLIGLSSARPQTQPGIGGPLPGEFFPEGPINRGGEQIEVVPVPIAP